MTNMIPQVSPVLVLVHNGAMQIESIASNSSLARLMRENR